MNGKLGLDNVHCRVPVILLRGVPIPSLEVDSMVRDRGISNLKIIPGFRSSSFESRS